LKSHRKEADKHFPPKRFLRLCKENNTETVCTPQYCDTALQRFAKEDEKSRAYARKENAKSRKEIVVLGKSVTNFIPGMP